MKTVNILIAGVGGQGSLLASRLLGWLFMRHDYEVKVSEVHGMSQRGGSVITTVKAGSRVNSPLIVPGECDLLIALEQLEAKRWIHYLKPTGQPLPAGRLVASTQRIAPMPVITGAAAYPDICDGLPGVWIDALGLAEQAGSAKCANLVLLGAAAHYLDFSTLEWNQAIAECVPSKAVAMNIKAFELGVRERAGGMVREIVV